MRLQIHFMLERPVVIPIDHLHALQGLVYRLLGTSDGEYARFLHEEGYRVVGEGRKRLKLFVFSGLRVAASRRRLEGDWLHLAPGPIEWFVSSPREDFLVHSATGLLSVGTQVPLAGASLTVTGVEALPTPTFGERERFTCQTPVVASVALPEGGTYYLRPSDSAAFSEAVRANLLRKYGLLTGSTPSDDRLQLEFDAGYLADPKHRGGTKLTRFKEIQIVGAFAPFTLSGSPELIRLGWECGLGEKNSAGFGMIELAKNGG